MKNKKLYKKERFAGCLLGAALGDALGYNVKGMSVEEIKKAYGKKGLIKFKAQKNQKTVKISDETQLMLFTAHGLLWADAVSKVKDNIDYTRYVFFSYQQWLATQTGKTSCNEYDKLLDDNLTGFPCTLLDIEELGKKRSPTKQLINTLSSIQNLSYGKMSKPINGNGLFDCLPRVLPAGLYFYADAERAFHIGAEIAATTHGNPDGYLSAGAFAAMIAYICKGLTIEKAALEAMKLLKEYDGFENCFALIDKALSLCEGDGSPADDIKELGNGSDAMSALAIGLYCAMVHYDYQNTVFLAANLDGNSDAIAFIAGALKGAYRGYHFLPQGWLKKLQLKDVIKSYASRLTKAAPKSF
ncbi:MAG: ADP-ribosylglycohydrolase family protein [Ruminococcaceae bacterium]|nr:ADP-ribosylglycohydrolase family protein [Oscillospiraceae bacterium]